MDATSIPRTFAAFRIHSDDDGYRSGIEQVPLEDLARDILRVGPVTETIGGVRIDPSDERLRVCEGVAAAAREKAHGGSR